MDNRPTLEEQGVIENIFYAVKTLGKISKEKIWKLYWELYDAPRHVVIGAERLFREIIEKEENGRLIPKKYIKKPEDIPALMYLIKGGLLEVQKNPYFFGIFKKRVVVHKDNLLKNIKSVFESLLYEALKAKHAREEEISYDQRKGWRY